MTPSKFAGNKWKIGLASALTALLFQNCGTEFQSLDEFKYGSDYANNIIEQSELQSYWDSIYNPDDLRSKNDVIFDSRRDSAAIRFFAEEVTAFVVVTDRTNNASFSLKVDADQVLNISIQSSKVILTHEAPADNYSQSSFNIEPGLPVVVAARSGKDPKNILIMVNGEFKTVGIQTRGTPLNFSYLENQILMSNIQEALVIKRTMEPGEINVLSRQIASLYGIPTRTTNGMPDYLAWSTESKMFPEVRKLMKTTCFKCHTTWISLSESGFTSASRYTKNIQLVKAKRLPESPLWHSLQGSTGNTLLEAKRDMPKDLPALSDEQLKLLKDWILQIP